MALGCVALAAFWTVPAAKLAGDKTICTVSSGCKQYNLSQRLSSNAAEAHHAYGTAVP